jgi:hypothetical protein
MVLKSAASTPLADVFNLLRGVSGSDEGEF